MFFACILWNWSILAKLEIVFCYHFKEISVNEMAAAAGYIECVIRRYHVYKEA